MKFTIILVAALAIFGIAPALAGDICYIEIGDDIPVDTVSSQWQTLTAAHKKLLGALKLYPKIIRHDGIAVAARIQAGPVSTKAKAERICARLFAGNVPCFVIEGLEKAPPETMIGQAGAKRETTGDSAPLPWRRGQVEVAEAIRVPLSEEESIPASPRPLIAAENPPPAGGGPGELNIGTFPDEDAAIAFWQSISAGTPMAGLHARVVRPLLTHHQPETSLRITPFASDLEAENFCRQYIDPLSKGLRCRFEWQEPAIAARSEHAEAYEARRRAVAAGRQSRENLRQYWLQVVSAASEMEALRQWESMRDANAGLLRGLRRSVSASAMDPGHYVVRIGPLPRAENAEKLCDILAAQGADCRVLLSPGM